MRIVLDMILASTLKQLISVIELNSPSYLVIIIMLMIIGQLLWWSWTNRKSYLKATINDVEQLEDGSYCISWGYINNTGKPIFLHHKESSLVVSNGAILLLGGQPPYQFDTGEHRQVMKIVALENTEVEWVIKEKRTKVVVNNKHKKRKEGKII